MDRGDTVVAEEEFFVADAEHTQGSGAVETAGKVGHLGTGQIGNCLWSVFTIQRQNFETYMLTMPLLRNTFLCGNSNGVLECEQSKTICRNEEVLSSAPLYV